jgi:D-alanyl-D-alanine carboxypeptidase/D-alanyl-D-alanine-endopeptidase (penicillin-binding protein 4)
MLAVILFVLSMLQPATLTADPAFPCLKHFTSTDAFLIADPDGRILYKKNEEKKCTPASTLKLLTALTAIHHFGISYRFRTEFYMDTDRNLKVKGYGDPLLISEVLQEIADTLAKKVREINDLVLDDTFFSPLIKTPWLSHSTNPYDAPVGALCTNFNTVFFDRDEQGRIVSAEPQTPLIPFVGKAIRSQGLESGRYTFTHDRGDATRYTGELLLHFLKERGVSIQGKIDLGAVGPEDRLIYTYQSVFTLEQALKKMMEFSNNFMANQIFIAVGAHVYGPPGTLAKGVRAVSDFEKNELHMTGIEIVEGSGISRENRVSPLHMLTILKHFSPYRHLLNRERNVLYKTGTLSGIRTRVGYIEDQPDRPYYFVIFLNRSGSNMDLLMDCLRQTVITHSFRAR